MRAEGLEPPRPKPLVPKTSASTNSATPAPLRISAKENHSLDARWKRLVAQIVGRSKGSCAAGSVRLRSRTNIRKSQTGLRRSPWPGTSRERPPQPGSVDQSSPPVHNGAGNSGIEHGEYRTHQVPHSSSAVSVRPDRLALWYWQPIRISSLGFDLVKICRKCIFPTL